MRTLFHWGCLLSFALIAPIALPAGGANKTQLKLINRKEADICVAGDSCFLYPFPSESAEPYNNVDLGTSLRIIRLWQNTDGSNWLQVQLSQNSFFNAPGLMPSRGWINVGFLSKS